MEFLQFKFYYNTIDTWILAAATTIFVMGVLHVIARVIVSRLITLSKRTDTNLDDLATNLLKRTNFFFLLIVSLYWGALVLTIPSDAQLIINRLTVVALLVQFGIWGDASVHFILTLYLKMKDASDAAKATTVLALSFLGRLALWVTLFLLALSNLGINVTALVAGLGVGGIAAALAVQNVLGDLFASLSIMLDEPFSVGDFIVIDDFAGTVEQIGLKTTRLRSLGGEQIIFSNADLLSSRIRNYKRMKERRVVFTLRVTYGTSSEKLQEIPAMIREIIETEDRTRFDRAHFQSYGESSLNYEIAYYVLTDDYNLFMDIHQNINLAIYRRFNAESIEFAYPTQTLYINRMQADPPAGEHHH